MNELREIDALVAEHVMGYTTRPSTIATYDSRTRQKGIEDRLVWVTPDGLGAGYDPPRYSVAITEAWEVVERMRGDYIFSLLDHITSWSASFVKLRGFGSKSIEAPTAPLAICLAALDVIPSVAASVAKPSASGEIPQPDAEP